MKTRRRRPVKPRKAKGRRQRLSRTTANKLLWDKTLREVLPEKTV